MMQKAQISDIVWAMLEYEKQEAFWKYCMAISSPLPAACIPGGIISFQK